MEKESAVLKTGYLLKWLIKRWKIQWFTLEEDQLTSHHKRDRSILIETIPLQGASVVCPCYDEPGINEETSLKLNTAKGEELLFQAAGMQDRDRWAHAIGAVIRSISSSSQVSNSPVKFQHFRVKANVSEVLGALQDPDAGVQMSSHVRNGIVHKNCFVGSEVIEWLLRWNIVRKRNDGIAMAQSLLKLGHLQEVDIADGTAGVMQFFKDDEKLYRFTSLNLGVQRNSYFDSSDSDSSLSEDEDDVEKIVEKVKKGKPVKAGYLCKKKSLRKGWRIVRLVIRENPPSLEYECPYKDFLRDSKKDDKANKSNQSMKYIDLGNCYLSESSRSTTEMGDMKSCKVSPKLRIYVRTKGQKCRTFQAKDEEEWFDYVSLFQSICKERGTPNKTKTDVKGK